MSEHKVHQISRSVAIERINLAHFSNSSDAELNIIKERVANDHTYNEDSVSNKELEAVLNKLYSNLRIEIKVY